MTLKDHDRKVLWGRAHNRCALCRKPLIADASTSGDRESVLGEEAHIVSPSPKGPRGMEPLEPLDCDIDAYGNRILLCGDDHTLIDQQPNEFPAPRVRQIKRDHERWAEQQFGPAPVQIRPDPAAKPPHFVALRTGDQVWALVAGAHAFRLDPPQDGEATVEQCDAADEFLGLARDWSEVAHEVTQDGPTQFRAVKRQLDDALTELHDLGLVTYGARRRLIIEGGVGPLTGWWEAILAVRLKLTKGDV